MTIHELFTNNEQEIIILALNEASNKANKFAKAPIRGFGKATEYEKKKDWKNKQEDIEQLLSKIADLSI